MYRMVTGQLIVSEAKGKKYTGEMTNNTIAF